MTASKGTVAGKVHISWNASAKTTVYEIWRANKPGSQGGRPVRIGKVDSNTFSFDDNSLSCNVNYFYWVTARNPWGVSRYSKYATGYCGSLP